MSYRRLLGGLLLWALVPMPFLYVVLPPFWLAAAAAAALALWRPQRTLRTPIWVENLVAVMFVVVVVATGGLRVGPIRPLGHLLLLLTAWRSLSVRDRSSFMRAAPAVFLLWLAAVASSTHVALAPYLVLSVVVWLWAGMTVLLLGLDPVRAWRPRDLPRLSHVLPAALCISVLAVPIFLVMPRIDSPWVAGSSHRRSSGFSTSVELARSGPIASSRELALTITTADGGTLDPRWTRLRGTAFNMVFAGTWAKGGTSTTPVRRRHGVDWLAEDVHSLDGTVRLELELLRPQEYLFVPAGSVAIRAPVAIAVDPAGGVVLAAEHSGPLRYTVWVVQRSMPRRDPPLARDSYLPKVNHDVRRLAEEVAGRAGSPRRLAQAIESHLQESYEYSLGVTGVRRSDPVAWFLLDGKAGHCEFFAGAMVVMLRHLGVPARLVGGYNGGSLAPDGATAAVRQANAHTWVEVWLGADEGWVVFDPTPPEGVPELAARSGIERLQWLWERLTDAWDRRVLTFGLGEQLGLLAALGAVVEFVSARVATWQLAALCALAGVAWLLRHRLWQLVRRGTGRKPPRPPAARLLQQLAQRLEGAGVEVPPRATIGWIAAEARRRWPLAGDVVCEVAGRAEQELYAAPAGHAPGRAQIRGLQRRLRRALRQAGDGVPAKG